MRIRCTLNSQPLLIIALIVLLPGLYLAAEEGDTGETRGGVPEDGQAVDEALSEVLDAQFELRFRLFYASQDLSTYLKEHPEGQDKLRKVVTSLVSGRTEARGEWGKEPLDWYVAMSCLPPDMVLEGVVPLLDEGSPEFLAMTRERQLDLLMYLERPDAALRSAPSLFYYRGYVRRHGDETPRIIIERMLAIDPPQAMRLLLAQRGKAMGEVRRVVQDVQAVDGFALLVEAGVEDLTMPPETVTAALNRLGEHEVWWVREYAQSVKRRWDEREEASE